MTRLTLIDLASTHPRMKQEARLKPPSVTFHSLKTTVNLDVGNTLANWTQGKANGWFSSPTNSLMQERLMHTLPTVRLPAKLITCCCLPMEKDHKTAPTKHASAKANCTLPWKWQLDDSASTMHATANQLPLMSNVNGTSKANALPHSHKKPAPFDANLLNLETTV